MKRGRQLLESEKKTNPDNEIPYFIENYIDFLTLTITEEYPLFNKLKDNKKQGLQDWKTEISLHLITGIVLRNCICNGHWSRIKYKEYVSAVIRSQQGLQSSEKK